METLVSVNSYVSVKNSIVKEDDVMSLASIRLCRQLVKSIQESLLNLSQIPTANMVGSHCHCSDIKTQWAFTLQLS